MNIEIANRLAKLRKEKGYSQEQLAEELDISRQAISKWERAEASPDTDNLIELAKLYNVSLDYLLGLDNEESKSVNKNQIIINENGIHIEDEEDVVDISKQGIQVVEKGEEVFTKNNYHKFKSIFDTCVSCVSVLVYVILGATMNLWHPGWLIFLLAIVLYSVPEMINKRRICELNYPVFITTLYLFLGFVFGLWHPYWFLFITIPIFYVVGGVLDKVIFKKL